MVSIFHLDVVGVVTILDALIPFLKRYQSLEGGGGQIQPQDGVRQPLSFGFVRSEWDPGGIKYIAGADTDVGSCDNSKDISHVANMDDIIPWRICSFGLAAAWFMARLRGVLAAQLHRALHSLHIDAIMPRFAAIENAQECRMNTLFVKCSAVAMIVIV